MTKEQTDKLNLNSPEGRMFNAAMAILTTEYKPNETFGFMFDKVQALAGQLPTPTPPEEPSGVGNPAKLRDGIAYTDMEDRYGVRQQIDTQPIPAKPKGLHEQRDHYEKLAEGWQQRALKAELELAKLQSIHNTLEWPSEEKINAVVAVKSEEWTVDKTDQASYEAGFIDAIQWLKSILK